MIELGNNIKDRDQSITTVEHYIELQRSNRRRVLWGAVFLAVITALSYVVFKANIFFALTVLVIFIVPVLFWRYPRFGLYMLLASVCLFELFLSNWPDGITDKVPFFWNVNTIFQRYTNAGSHLIPLSILELYLIALGVVATFRSVYTRSVDIRLGKLFWPVLIYMGFVAFGWVNGMGSGGDFKISLQEVRSQFYFAVAYILAVNSTRERKNITTLLWITIGTIGLKGAMYTLRRYIYITLPGLPLPDQGVGSHEEAFLFDCFIALYFALLFGNAYPRMRTVMLILMPLVILGNLACNRRASTAAMALMIPVLLIASYYAYQHRRRLILAIGITLIVGFSIYYPLYKNKTGTLAQPARAIKSQFEPDARDLSSNQYRIAEEADLYATIHLSPITGYGYGKRMLHAVPIVDISATYPWWDIMTHNQILWVWMRVGTVGFISFWMMVASIIILATSIITSRITPEREDAQARLTRITPEREDHPFAYTNEMKAVAIFVLTTTAALMMFGLLDLQLSNFRDMLFAGLWAGILASIPLLSDQENALQPQETAGNE